MDSINENVAESVVEASPESVETLPESRHSLTFDEKVIKKIVGYATGEITGVLASGSFISGITDILRSSEGPTKGITIEMNGNMVSVGMRVICEYGRNVPEIFKQIIEAVSTNVKEMTGMEVSEVKVHVYDVLTKEDFDRQRKKKPEQAEQVLEAGESAEAEQGEAEV